MTIPEQNQNGAAPDRPDRTARFGAGQRDRLPPDPLPPEVEAPLRSLDARLAAAARRTESPAGLEDRVYASSVRRLPRPARCRPHLVTAPLVTAKRGPRYRSLVFQAFSSRLAMAASLGLAVVFATALLPDRDPGDQGGVARVTGDADPAAVPTGPSGGLAGGLADGLAGGLATGPAAELAAGPAMGTADMAWLDNELFEDMDRSVAHILDTRTLTMADLAGELNRLVASEM